MSKLNELIEKMCPNGVAYKTLGEIKTEIYRGNGIKRDEITEKGISCVRYGEIYTTYGIWFDECVSHTLLANVKSPKYFEHGDLLFAVTGESIEDIAKTTAYMGNERCLAGGDIVVLKHNQNPKYLSYVLSTSFSKKQKSVGKVKSKVVHASMPSIEAIKVPVPPKEIQDEIVRIMDEYTEKKNKLVEELKREISNREKQYEFYIDRIMEFKESGVDECLR